MFFISVKKLILVFFVLNNQRHLQMSVIVNNVQYAYIKIFSDNRTLVARTSIDKHNLYLHEHDTEQT